MEQLQRLLAQLRLENRAGSQHIAPEARGVVLARVQRNPGHWRQFPLLAPAGHPGSYQRRLAGTCRRREQNHTLLQTLIQTRKQCLTLHQRSAQARRSQLRPEEFAALLGRLYGAHPTHSFSRQEFFLCRSVRSLSIPIIRAEHNKVVNFSISMVIIANMKNNSRLSSCLPSEK